MKLGLSSPAQRPSGTPGSAASSVRINPWVIALTVMLATFMEVLDTSVANVALPHIAGNLSASIDESTWVLTSYLVSNAIMLPLAGWFSTLFGRKRFYMICVLLFTLSSFLCGLAPSLGMLVLFRIMQGLGGGAMQPISQAILVESFPKPKQGMAMAVYGMGVVVAPIIGPTLGGWITDDYSWRWIFLINIPVGVLSLALTAILIFDPPFLERKTLRGGLKIDYIGLSLLAAGLGFLEVLLDKGQREDWLASRLIVASLIIAAACLVTVAFWEWRQKEPVVDLRLLRDRNFGLATGSMFMLGFVLYSSTVLLPILLQTLLGYTALLSGLVLSPGGIATLVLLPVVGRLVSKVEARWLVAFGLAIGAMGLFQMAGFNSQVDFRTAMMARVVQSAGLAFLFVPLNTLAFSFVPKEKINRATGLINLARNIGGSSGIAMVTTMLARRAQFHQQVLVSHLTPYDYNYREIIDHAAAMLAARGSSATQAIEQAHGLLYQLVQRESAMMAFIDNFWMLGLTFLALIPVMFLMKRNVSPASRA
ncbi:MAG TPA: DHA2 family efflux MFS transporter permease subunit [Bryobacteraceae bacterium]|nr:DHA2 family efflux MFS transporter permease subunit [Bryobacteraceae bacterium]